MKPSWFHFVCEVLSSAVDSVENKSQGLGFQPFYDSWLQATVGEVLER